MAPKTEVSAWMKFFPSDWISGTRSLSPLAKAAFIDLLCFAWENGSIPDDPKKLWRTCGMSEAEFTEAWQELQGKWEAHPDIPGRLINPKQERVRSIQESRARGGRTRSEQMTPDQKSKQGRQAARARWNPDASSMPAQCQLDAGINASTMPGTQGSGPRTKRESANLSQIEDLVGRLAKETITSYRIDSKMLPNLERTFLSRLTALMSAGMEPESGIDALRAGIARCNEKAGEQARKDPIGKLLHKLQGDGGDDLGGIVQDALEELKGGKQ